MPPKVRFVRLVGLGLDLLQTPDWAPQRALFLQAAGEFLLIPEPLHSNRFHFIVGVVCCIFRRMLRILLHPDYAKLFSAQVIALIGTGLLTVALGLLAYDLSGERAGAVLGTAFAIKMVAYVGLAPIANAIAARVPRKALLISMDMVRAAVVLGLPFIDSVWQVYVMIFVLQSASATFTPAFQAIIPDILEDEADYTKALSLSRLAYDLENLVSPVLAGLLLLVMSYHGLFGGTVIGFICSAILVSSATVPTLHGTAKTRSFRDRLTRGIRIYLATPRLKGLLALNLAAAAAGAFVIVNTVVMVKAGYEVSETGVAMALAAFGAGSMLAALSLPRFLEQISDRQVMVVAGVLLTILTLGHGVWMLTTGLLVWPAFLISWALSGMFYAAILTPSGRLLRRSSHAEDRSSVFAAQFALSHACWLVTYPVAGWAGKVFGLPVAMLLLGGLATVGVAIALRVWPQGEISEIAHDHPDLPRTHPHLRQYGGKASGHRHVFVIDDEHRAWPTQG